MSNTKQLMQKRRDAMIASGEMTEAQWYALEQVFPGAKPESKVMAWEYCKARNLDPFRRPVHIVPMQVRDSDTGKQEWRDVIMPGVAELRTTAHRTGQHAGMSDFRYGPNISYLGIEVPEWIEVTVYRMIGRPGMGYQKAEFPGRVQFAEVAQTTKDKRTGEIRLNHIWSRRPIGQACKCCEADALRRAFPEELGAEFTAEEMQNAPIDTQYQVEPKAAAEQAMSGYDLIKTIAETTDDEVLDSVFRPAYDSMEKNREAIKKTKEDAADLGQEIADEINEDLAKKKAPKKRGRKAKTPEEKAQDEFAEWAQGSEEKDKDKPF